MRRDYNSKFISISGRNKLFFQLTSLLLLFYVRPEKLDGKRVAFIRMWKTRQELRYVGNLAVISLN